ncbi:MAG: PTS sugar transporter subunit IIB [Candidatus Riflebacteria bacterium]|nr:PTS sugar transporter subunit IIB [Candidatus Riflebacteria bacterium]
MKQIKFLRIDDRLIHGQVIVGWLPKLSPKQLLVVNEKIQNDFMRQELMSLSVPENITLSFSSPEEAADKIISDSCLLLTASPEDAWHCLQNGVAPEVFNVGGMHSKPGKEEIFEALHLDSQDRKYFKMIIDSGVEPVFQPTPQNEPLLLSDIL